jgi:hypothetical protein
MLHRLPLLLIITAAVTALAAAPVHAAATTTAPATITTTATTAASPNLASAVAPQAQIDQLRVDLAHEKDLREEHDGDASYFLNVVAIIIGVGALIITIAGVVATAAGYRFTRDYVERAFDRRVDEAFEEQAKPLLEARVKAIEDRADAVLAEQLERFGKAMNGGNG